MRPSLRVAGLLAAIAGTLPWGCAVEPPEGVLVCATAAECPGGWACRADSRCWKTRGAVDAGADAPATDGASSDSGDDARSDSGHDAPPADAPPADAPPADAEDAGDAGDAGGDSAADAGGGCSPAQCDDLVGCTNDACGAGGACVHVPDDGQCVAFPGGHCDQVNGCQYPTCTPSSCVAGPCEVAACVGDTCQRTSACSPGQQCCAGGCVAAGCDDANPCTADACGASGCVSTPTPGIPCADDGNPCTADACGAGGQCEHPPVADATPCGGTDRCSAGSCVAMNTAEHCGSWNIRCAAGRSCMPVPDAPAYYTCTCLGFADCQPNGFGGSATCYTDSSIGKTYCLCQCGAVGTCTGQCADGYLCYNVAGDNYCAP
ncbi:MAG: hypothetical protein IT376_13395 [Polyangiaceae bacterium]|nr:hypothetical protein [Polyangiaceae bacterium]